MSGITITGGVGGIQMGGWSFSSQVFWAFVPSTPTVQTDQEYTFHSSGAGTASGPLLDVQGSGFTYQTVSGHDALVGGTINTFTASDANHNLQFTISGLNISVQNFLSDAQLGTSGFENALFGAGVTINGGSANDLLKGFAGNDTINGGAGDDQIDAGKGSNVVSGGDGNDVITCEGNDTVDGGAGSDTVSFLGLTSGLNLDLTQSGRQTTGAINDHFTSVETFDLTPFNDVVTAGAGNDTFTGGNGGGSGGGNDTFHLEAGGSDKVTDTANATVYVGGAWDATDVIDIEGNNTKIIVNGDYSALTALPYTAMTDVHAITFEPGHNYNFKFTGPGIVTQLDGSALGAGDSLKIDMSGITMPGPPDEINYGIQATGGAGNDTFLGPNNAINDYHLEAGGNDTVKGGTGLDVIYMGASYTSADSIDGGSGSDILDLNGDYSVNHLYTATDISSLQIRPGHNYNLTAGAGIAAPGNTLAVNANTLGASDSATFDGTALTVALVAIGGAGNDVLTGGSGNDTFGMYKGGNDSVSGNGGNDSVTFADFGPGDHVDGGAGIDTLQITGAMPTTLTLDPVSGNIHNVEHLALAGAQDYSITVDAGYAASLSILTANDAGHVFNLDSRAIAGAQVIHTHGQGTIQLGNGGSAVTLYSGGGTVTGGTGHDVIVDTGTAADTISGGDGNDSITTGAGNDVLDGGAGSDVIALNGGFDHVTTGIGNDAIDVFKSYATGSGYATITDFDASHDRFVFFSTQATPSVSTITAVDPTVTHGQLDSGANMDADLIAALGPSHLGADHAVIFKPDSGTLAGHAFLVVDGSNTAGYQSGDFVIELGGASSTTVKLANFAFVHT